MSSSLLISVLVPVYNVKKYLEQCLDSLHAQTFKECEFILVDDGSTDGSGEILDRYAHDDTRFKVVHLNKNYGSLIARKKLINFANGKYCIFIDSDDYIPFNSVLDKLYRIAEKYNVDILQFDVDVDCDIIETKNNMLNFLNSDDEIDITRDIVDECFVKGPRWTLWNKIYNTNILKKAYQYIDDEHLVCAEDVYIFFLCAYFSISFKIVHTDPLYMYRVSSGITTKEYGIKDFEKFAKEIIVFE